MTCRTATALGIRPRELRCRVILPARMRTGAGWSDACILNVSSRGLQIHASRCTPMGSSVELWHGDRVIAAKVVWRNGPRAGLHSEERIPVEEVLSLGQSPALQLTAGNQRGVERRAVARTQDASRFQGRAIEFLSIVAMAAALSSGLFLMVLEAFARPLAVLYRIFGG